MVNQILFYKVTEKFGEFSNFYPSPIILVNENWLTVEHFFQANKFEDFKIWDKIKGIESPMDAAKEGRNRTNMIRPDWESVKDIIMFKAVRAKFMQHPNLKKILLQTGDSLIVEHTSNDNYWGDGGDGYGKNMLGKTLMQVRDELRTISTIPDLIFPPYIAFPNTDSLDMFWRMGRGEDYLKSWFDYINVFGNESYQELFPLSAAWLGDI